MPAWSNAPKLWRILGKAKDGLSVTLGRYETEPEAQTDLQRFTRDGNYRSLELQAITPPPPSTTSPQLPPGRRPPTRPT